MPRLSPPRAPPLVSLALRPLPLAPLQGFLSRLLRDAARRHPAIFDRLGEHGGKRFGLRPIDLPLAIVLEPAKDRPKVAVVRRLPARLDVCISGPLAALVGMIEGAYDGDALFFSRDLAVEGDVEAVLALRNAIDDAEIDLAGEAAAMCGPFGAPVRMAWRGLSGARRAPRAAPFTRAGRAWS